MAPGNSAQQLKLIQVLSEGATDEWIRENRDRFTSFATFETDSKNVSWTASMTALSFSHLTKEQTKQLLTCLPKFPKLSSITLTESPLSRKLVRLFARSVNQPLLKRLDLSSCEIHEEAMGELMDLFCKFSNLARLKLDGVKFPGQSAHGLVTALLNLGNFYSLTHVSLAGNGFDAEFMSELMRALSKHKNLQVLKVSDNHFGAAGMEAIMNVIPSLHNLEYLELAGNSIGKDSSWIPAVVANLPKSKRLHTLNLSRNGISDRGFCSIIRSLPHDTQRGFSKLDLSHNTVGVGFAKLCKWMEPKKSKTLQFHTLDLSSNTIPNSALLTFAEKLRTGVLPLRNLDLSDNSIPEYVASKILAAYGWNKSLKDLNFALGGNPISIDMVREFDWVARTKGEHSSLVNYPVVNLTVIGNSDQDNDIILSQLNRKSRFSREVAHTVTSSKGSGLYRESPRPLYSNSPVSFSLVGLKHHDFVHYYPLLCNTTARLAFLISDNVSIPHYLKRIKHWISFLANVQEMPSLVIALRCDDPAEDIGALKLKMDDFITKMQHRFGGQAYFAGKVAFFLSKKSRQQHPECGHTEALEECGKDLISRFPIYLPLEVVEILTSHQNKLVYKIMLRQKILEVMRQRLHLNSFDAGELFRRIASSRTILKISDDRVCTDVTWFYHAIIDSLLSPETIRSSAAAASASEPWFLQESNLKITKTITSSGAEFPGLIHFVCRYLATHDVWNELTLPGESATYFHPIMLPRTTKDLRGKFDTCECFFPENGFVLGRRLYPSQRHAIIPPFVFHLLQCRFYERLCSDSESSDWKYELTQTSMYFSHANGSGVRICTPSLSHIGSSLMPYSFFEIHIVSKYVTTTCALYHATRALIQEIMEEELSFNFLWNEVSVPPVEVLASGIFDFCAEPLHPAASFFDRAHEGVSVITENGPYKNVSVHTLIPDILNIDPPACKVEHELSAKNILTVRIRIFGIMGLLRVIPRDRMFVGLLTEQGFAMAEYKGLDPQQGVHSYHIYVADPTASVLICTPYDQPQPLGNTPVPMSKTSQERATELLADWTEQWEKDQGSKLADYRFLDTTEYVDQKEIYYTRLIARKEREAVRLKQLQMDEFDMSDYEGEDDLASATSEDRSSEPSSQRASRRLHRDRIRKLFRHRMAGVSFDAAILCKISYTGEHRTDVTPRDRELLIERSLNQLSFHHHSHDRHAVSNFKLYEPKGVPLDFLGATKPSFFVFERSKEIYVVIRATKGFRHLAENAKRVCKIRMAIKNRVKGTPKIERAEAGRVHAGFVNYANVIVAQLDSMFSHRYEKPEFQKKALHICGHSLGGAVALVLTRMLLEAREWTGRIRTVTFGAPLVGDEKYVQWSGWNSSNLSLYNFANEKDPVPSLLIRDNMVAEVASEPIKFQYVGKCLRVFDHCTQKVKIVKQPNALEYLKSKMELDPDEMEQYFVVHSISYYKSNIAKWYATAARNRI